MSNQRNGWGLEEGSTGSGLAYSGGRGLMTVHEGFHVTQLGCEPFEAIGLVRIHSRSNS